MGGSIRFWFRVVAAAIAAAVGLGLGLEKVGAWHPPRALVVGLVAIGVSVAFLIAVEAAVDQYRHGRVEELREQARAVLAPLLIELEHVTGVSSRQIGVAAYRLRPRIVPWQRARLERLVRLQLVIRVSSGIAWRAGLGVIGQCVERGEDVVENLAALDEQLVQVGAGDWESLPDDLRYGMSYQEYQRVRGKYDVVLATPVIRDTPLGSKVIGCIAVDAPRDAFEVLADQETRGLVAAAAVPLAALISQPRLGWR